MVSLTAKEESPWIMISEWNLSMLKYWAKAGEIERIRMRLRIKTIVNLIWLFIDFLFG
jgi:hypothetical protein